MKATKAQRAFLIKIGRKGGKATTAAKAAAVRRNGCQPCRPGKRRGHPFTKNKPSTGATETA